MIEVKNLVKDYGGHLAVDHLSFTIEDGQIYGFLGPNGAGKSTTMNIMTGYIGATKGDVLINGHNILEDAKEAKRCIGYLPELPPLYVDMTVNEQLEFSAELKKIPKRERKQAVDQVVELAKLKEVRGRLIRNLSKGYRQRVGLAQAVLGMPPVIILDEPTVGLDPKQMIEIRDTIKELGQSHTVILSSHILSEVSAVCDHIMIIDRGRLIASDTPENLERQMAGEAGMKLLVKGTEEEVRSVLDSVEGLENIQITASEEEGIQNVAFRLAAEKMVPEKSELEKSKTNSPNDYEPVPENSENMIQENEESEPAENMAFQPMKSLSADIRETIFYAFAKSSVPILSMQATKASLEQVFLELTAEEEKHGVSDGSEGGSGGESNDESDQESRREEGDSHGSHI